jgi:hypothetical protein
MEPDSPHFTLVVIEGPDAVVDGQEVREAEFNTTRIIIGRIQDISDFQLYSRSEESSVSRFHCAITFDRALNVFLLTDLESRAGTRLNDVRLAPHNPVELKSGDQITLGEPARNGAIVQFLMDEVAAQSGRGDERLGKIRQTITRQTGLDIPTTATGGLGVAAFISYDHADERLMKRVNETLYGAYRIACWTDASLEPGTHSWQKMIEENLENTPCLIVLMTPNSKVSEWVASEISYGRQQDCHIFPVLADGDERSAIPISLISMQYIDIRHDFDLGMRRLADAVRAHLDSIEQD